MKAMLGLVIVVLIVFLVVLFRPTGDNTATMTKKDNQQEIVQPSSTDDSAQSSTTDQLAAADDDKYEKMTARYQLLEKARTRLKRKLSRLQHELWGKNFPKEQAKEFNELMLNAHKLIKNPYKLGAFSSVKDIQDEIDSVTFAGEELEEIMQVVESATQADMPSENSVN